MGILSGVKTSDNVQEAKDIVGGTGYKPLDSNVYMLNVLHAYVLTAASGAKAISFEFETNTEETLKTDIYFCSGDEKGNKTYYTKDGEDYPLPGFTQSDDFCLLALGVPLEEVETERKWVKVWDKDAGGEIDKEVDMLAGIKGTKVLGAVMNNLEMATKKEGKKYVETGETRNSNEIVKFFDADSKQTTNEIRKEQEEAIFIDQWLETWEGKERDRTKGRGKTAANDGAAGAPSGTKPKSVFGKKKAS